MRVVADRISRTANLTVLLVSLAVPLSAQELRVIDSNGVDVGQIGAPPRVEGTMYYDHALVLLHVNDDWVPVAATRAGFVSSPSTFFTFAHDTTDCSGPRYKESPDATQSLFPFWALVNGSNLFYTTGPYVQITRRSVETFAPGADVTLPGTCTTVTSTDFLVSATTQFDLSSLGLVPPFSFR